MRFVDGPSGRRAALVGSGLDVWEIVASARENDGDLAATASYLEISPGTIEAAVNYYGAYPEEIDRQIALNQAAWERGYSAWEAGQRALAT